MLSCKRALMGATALALAGFPELAAEAAPATLDSVIVTARPDPEDPPVVGEARARLSQTPGAVSVISAESYERRFATALDDMLRDAPGVFAQKKWGGDVRIAIRGSGLGNANHNRGLLLAQDGAPLNEADGFGDTQGIDPLIARYTEVYRGGNALRFGGALLGGAVNVVTPTGRDAGFGYQARIDGGSFGALRQHLAMAQARGGWDLYAAATNQTGQGPRPQSQQNLQFGTLSLGRRLGEDREVRLIVAGANIAQEIPGALTRAQFDADPQQAAPGNYANDQGRNQRSARATLRTRWRLSEAAVFEGAAYAAWKDLDHPIFQVIDQQSRNYGAFGRVSWEGELGGRRADAFAGLWLRQGDLDSNFYVNVRGARGAPTSISLQNARAADAFAEGRLFVSDRLALVAGATWGIAERDYRSVRIAGQPNTFDVKASRTYEWLAPRVGVLWQDEGGAQLFANLTRSVEPPNFSALSPTGTGFARIAAQEAWTAEAGARGRRGAFTWDVTAYRASLDDELLMFAAADGTGPSIVFNADDTTHQGVEAALDWRLSSSLRLRQSYTWSDFRFDGEPRYFDNRLPVAPQHLYRAELRYAHPAGWFVAPSVEWSPKGAWADFDNTARAPGYAVVNLGAGVALAEGVSLFLDARNLADEAYISNVQPVVRATAASAVYWPGDRRSVFGGMQWRF